MTKAEWLAATDPRPMLEFLRGKASDRKLRLYFVAYLHSIWHLLPNDWCRRAVVVSESFADKTATLDELEAAQDKVTDWQELIERENFEEVAYAHEVHTITNENLLWPIDGVPKRIREVFNPFHPITVDPTWLTPTVVALATGIYADKAFDRIPILSDALEEAGCDNVDMLLHCRIPGEHVRGCWVIDLLTGRK